MSSSIPYDPDEFDNNPFAEPQQDVNEAPVDAPEAVAEAPAPPAEAPEQDTTPVNKQVNSAETAAPAASLLPERAENKYKMVVKVTGLERSGSLTNKKENPAIIFDVKTNLPAFRKNVYKSVKKSYSEFHQFFKFLNGANPECFIPSLPLSFTNYGITNEEDYTKTLSNFQIWFNRITSNPILIKNEEFIFFIESDFNTYSPINKSKLPASGLKRKTLKQFQPPYDEVIELAEFRPLIKSIYQLSSSIELKLEKLTRLRKSYGMALNEMGTRFQEFEEFEESDKNAIKGNNKMQTLWKKFGKTITIQGDLESIIGSLDLATLGDGLTSIKNDSYVIKEALTNRHLLMRDLITAQTNTRSKHDFAKKLKEKRDLNPIKVDEAITNLKIAVEVEEKLSLKIKRITENMLIEKKQYLEYFDTQLKRIFKEFIIKRIEYERRKLSSLEKIRIDVRLADINGGLSRLGRDKTSNNNLIMSQGLNGDSWSGDRKVSHISKELYDRTLEEEQAEEDEILDASNPADDPKAKEDELLADAKNAASLLGGSTF